MKTLKESLLDDIDTTMVNGSIDMEEYKIDKIKTFIDKNYQCSRGYEISKKPSRSGIYTVNSKGKVRFIGASARLTNEFFVWGTIEMNFSCNGCGNLETLEGGPKKVNGNFDCSYCKNIKSLYGAPKEVNGDFSCTGCISIKALFGMPKTIGGSFNCSHCDNLLSFAGGPKEVKRDFRATDCPNLESYTGKPVKLGGQFIVVDKNKYKVHMI